MTVPQQKLAQAKFYSCYGSNFFFCVVPILSHQLISMLLAPVPMTSLGTISEDKGSTVSTDAQGNSREQLLLGSLEEL